MRHEQTSPSCRQILPASLGLVMIVGAGAAPALGQCELDKLTASDGVPDALFGIGSALSGNVALVSANSDIAGDEPGAVYVYRFDGTQWNEESKLLPPDGVPGDRFGSAAIDGPLAIVGAYQDDDAGLDAGSAYAFRFDGSVWAADGKLIASGVGADDWFGIVTAISGNVALIASPRDDDAGDNAGAVYVYRRGAGGWQEETKLIGGDVAAGHFFGYPVAISGNLAIVGAYGDTHAGTLSGALYVYRHDGCQWVEETKLTASDAETLDLYGLWADTDGHVIVIGAEGDDDGGDGAGAAYVYRHDGASWNEEAKLVPSDAAPGDRFGGPVVEGNLILAGCIGRDDAGDDAGAVYVFRYDGSSWNETAKLIGAGVATDDWFGNSVAVEGDFAFIGAHKDDDEGTDAGAAYVYTGITGIDVNDNGLADGCEALCPADTNGDGVVDIADILVLLGGWGTCP